MRSSTCDSSLHGLYFAPWYLYLNSDGVTYEGGTHRTKRDRMREPRRKLRKGKEKRRPRGKGEATEQGSTRSLALCRRADSVIF